MKVLIVTNMYPTAGNPAFGTFVKGQVESLRKAGVEVDVLFIDGRRSRWNYLWGLFRFWAKIWKEQYDLVHCHYIFSGIIGRMQRKYPVVVTHHGAEVISQSWVASLTRLTHHWFDKVIVVSQALKEHLNDPAIALVPCGIDFEEMRLINQIEARNHLNLPLDKRLVLWAGEFWQREKRYYLVEEAMALAQKDWPEAQLIRVSGQPHSIIPYYMNACDVLVLTSSLEGSPMVIKEAMACNLPIVSTDVGDIAEVIAGVEGCFLCEPDPGDVFRKLMKVLYRGERANGREKIAYLDSKLVAQKLIRIYRELCPKTISEKESEQVEGTG